MGKRIVMTLERHEAAIQSAVDSAEENVATIAKHLKAISDGNLYQEKYGSFKQYMSERWNRSRAEGYRLINMAKVLEDVSRSETPAPESVSQTAEIAKASDAPEVREEIWTESQKAAQSNQPTAAVVKTTAVAVVKRHKSVQDVLADQRSKNLPTPETIAIDVIVGALVKLQAKADRMLTDLHEAVDAKAKSTSKMATTTASMKKKIDRVKEDVDEFETSISTLAKSWEGYRKQVDDLA